MRSPFKIVTILLILFVLLPSMLLARGDISGYKLMYSKLNKEQLYSQKQRVNLEIFESTLISTGGVALTGLGVLSTAAGVALIASQPIITFDPEDDFQLLLWPIILTAYVVQYGGGIALIGSGAGLCYAGVGITISASGNIAFQIEKKRQIQLELKQFSPISYKYQPGIGVGVSMALN